MLSHWLKPFEMISPWGLSLSKPRKKLLVNHVWKLTFFNTVVLLSIVVLAFVSGCNGGRQGPQGTQGSGGVSRPALGAYLPPLDGGRVEIAGPKDWELMPRSGKYLFRIKKAADQATPLIALTAEDFKAGDLVNLDGNSVQQFVELMAEKTGKSAKSMRPIKVGDRYWVAYRRRAQASGRVSRSMEVLRMDTLAGGRLYSLQLVCELGELEQFQDYLLAVARGVRFIGASQPGSHSTALATTKAGVKSASGEDSLASEASPEDADATALAGSGGGMGTGKPGAAPASSAAGGPLEATTTASGREAEGGAPSAGGKPKPPTIREQKTPKPSEPTEKPKADGIDLDLDALDELLR